MRSLERLLAILEAVDASQRPASPSWVADKTGLSTSTSSRLMRMMLDEGLLERANGDAAYVLGSRLLRLGQRSPVPQNLVEAAFPEMQALRDRTSETVSLHVRHGYSRVCVAQIESHQEVRRVVPLGAEVDLHNGAPGIVFLASFPEAELDEYLRTHVRTAKERTILRRLVGEQHRNGYTIDDLGIWVKDITGAAAPIHSDLYGTLAALTVSGPSFRWTRDKIAAMARDLIATAERIALTSYRPPSR